MGSFTVKFQTNLGRKDVEAVDAVSLLDRALYVRRDDGDWLEVADLSRSALLRPYSGDAGEFSFRLFDVSDHPQGRFIVSGRRDQRWQPISDQASSCRGDASGVFLYTQSANFWLDWDAELCAWIDSRDSRFYDELLIARYRVPLGPRLRLSSLAS